MSQVERDCLPCRGTRCHRPPEKAPKGLGLRKKCSGFIGYRAEGSGFGGLGFKVFRVGIRV